MKVRSFLFLCCFSFSLLAKEEKKVHIFCWTDFFSDELIEEFEKETGIKVIYDTVDSNEVLEAKLLAGNSGYDVVCPSASPFFARQKKAGVYQKIDQKQLPNFKNLDPNVLNKFAEIDPGTHYGIPYSWGTTGFGYNIDKIKKIFPKAPTGSLAMLFDPGIAAKFAKCGISLLDSPTEVLDAALLFKGKPPNPEKPKDLKTALETLMQVRPYILRFNASSTISDLANGNLCIAQGWSADIVTANKRAKEAGNGVRIAYVLPKEGAELWSDMVAIPVAAPHPKNAHKFINFILQGRIAASITNETNTPTAVATAKEYLKKEIRDNPAIYPPTKYFNKMFLQKVLSKQGEQSRTRNWARVRVGK